MPSNRRRLLRRPLRIAATCLALAAPAAASAQDPIVDFSATDPVMNAAIEGARRTLDGFFDLMAAPPAGATDFAVKVAVPVADADGSAEHIWVRDCSGPRDALVCSVANEPVRVDLRHGERVAVDRERISDWTYEVGGMMHGNFTLRPMLERLPVDEAAALSALLAPLPH